MQEDQIFKINFCTHCSWKEAKVALEAISFSEKVHQCIPMSAEAAAVSNAFTNKCFCSFFSFFAADHKINAARLFVGTLNIQMILFFLLLLDTFCVKGIFSFFPVSRHFPCSRNFVLFLIQKTFDGGEEDSCVARDSESVSVLGLGATALI